MTPVMPCPPCCCGFLDHAVVGLEPALVDHLRDLRDLAAGDIPQPRAEAADEAQRIDAVADHQLAGSQPLEIQAVHFVAGQARHHGHGSTPWVA